MENYAINYEFVLMPDSMPLIETYWTIITGAADTHSPIIRKVIIQGLILVKQCIKLVSLPEAHYMLLKNKEGLEVTACLELLHERLFSSTSITKVLVDLVSLYFILNDEDLVDWRAVRQHISSSQMLILARVPSSGCLTRKKLIGNTICVLVQKECL